MLEKTQHLLVTILSQEKRKLITDLCGAFSVIDGHVDWHF
jgi:hypothetical protein